MPPFGLTRAKARHTALTLAVVACAARPGVAAAEPDAAAAPASLELDADPSCVTRAGLISRVRARSPRVRFVDAGGLAIRVQIATTPTGAVTAEVTLANLGASSSSRHVRAGSCAEASDAVALIIAVTLDPTSLDARPNSSAPNDDAAAAAADAVNGAAKATASNAEAPAKIARKNDLSAPIGEAAGNDAGALTVPRSRLSFALQLAGEAVFGVAPGVMPGGGLYGTVAFERPSLWSPSFTLGARHAWRSEIQEPGGRASFALDAATLDACPLRLRWRAIEARPCGSVLFGRVTARGSQTFNPAAESARPFWVLGGAASVSADFPAGISLSTRLALGANLVRDSFEFRPALFHEVPSVSAALGVAIGMRWE